MMRALTGHRARIWLLIPLVPLTQINAIAAIMSAIGLSVAWWPVFAFLLVLVWWESPLNDDEWKLVYRVSAVLFEVFLLVFSYWLPAQTANSMLITFIVTQFVPGGPVEAVPEHTFGEPVIRRKPRRARRAVSNHSEDQDTIP